VLLPHFSWDHAQDAQPIPVSEKVLSKIDDKNLFIAICARSERVVHESALSKVPFLPVTTVKESALEWKTSDWIIQEIGLAVGRNMSVLVFLENDLRKPGGLVGDIEYISFSRENLQPAFEKLLQMLGALTPKQLPAASPITDLVAAPTQEEAKEDRDVGAPRDDTEPSADWDQETYDHALFRAIVFGENQELIREIDAAYRASHLATNEALVVWEARAEYLRMLKEEKWDFEKIKRLSDSYPKNGALLFFVGQGYRYFDDHETAARTFEQAAEHATEKVTRVNYLSFAAEEYARAGNKSKPTEIADALRTEAVEDPDLTTAVLAMLRDVAALEKDDDFWLAASEQMVEFRVGDVSLRFTLAFKHSETGNSDMALYHYLKIPPRQRTSTTWNNLGVSFSEIGMPVRAVRAWRTSAQEKDTLAMSNLGFKLLGAGFFEEAKKECDEALQIPKYHKNVPELLKRLNEVGEEEDKELDEALEKVKEKASFYRKLGEATLRPAPADVAANWNSPSGAVQVTIAGDIVRIDGAHERPENSLAAILGVTSSASQKRVMHRIRYDGRLRGSAILGDVKRSRDGEQTSLLGGENSSRVFMYFAASYTELRVMENPQSKSPTFYSLTQANSRAE